MRTHAFGSHKETACEVEYSWLRLRGERIAVCGKGRVTCVSCLSILRAPGPHAPSLHGTYSVRGGVFAHVRGPR